jgi:hypothetical protein
MNADATHLKGFRSRFISPAAVSPLPPFPCVFKVLAFRSPAHPITRGPRIAPVLRGLWWDHARSPDLLPDSSAYSLPPCFKVLPSNFGDFWQFWQLWQISRAAGFALPITAIPRDDGDSGDLYLCFLHSSVFQGFTFQFRRFLAFLAIARLFLLQISVISVHQR